MKALTLKPAEIGISRERYPEDVWGILMEFGVEKACVTLVVVADGSTSLYFSSGGGVIGAGQHDSVRQASTALLARANRTKSRARPAQDYPLPTRGQVIFYFLSYDGVLKDSAPEVELLENRDELSALFHSGHEVISAIRETQQRKGEPPPAR